MRLSNRSRVARELVALVSLCTYILALAPRVARAESASPPPAVAPQEQPPAAESDAPDAPLADAPLATARAMISSFTGSASSEVAAQAIALPTGGGSVQGLGESFSAQPSTGIAGASIPFKLLP